jgi:hypothetical protein
MVQILAEIRLAAQISNPRKVPHFNLRFYFAQRLHLSVLNTLPGYLQLRVQSYFTPLTFSRGKSALRGLVPDFPRENPLRCLYSHESGESSFPCSEGLSML